MARIKALPGIEIIRGFKGTIDFYLWKGLPVARRWPRYRPERRTAASIAAGLLFGEILKSYRLVADEVLAFFREDAADQPRTPRDIYVSATLGHLHEASMSDFLDLLTECRNSLLALEALLGALGSVDTDDLQVDVKTSALPTGAATLAEQQTQTAHLDTIDQLANALQSAAADRFLARGMDQLFSIDQVVTWALAQAVSGPDGFLDSAAVPAGKYWLITTIRALNSTRPSTDIRLANRHNGGNHFIHNDVRAIDTNEGICWSGLTALDATDTIRAYYIGAQANDIVRLEITGLQMTVET